MINKDKAAISGKYGFVDERGEYAYSQYNRIGDFYDGLVWFVC